MLNATCPLVTKVHKQGSITSRQGRTVILIGHAGHPEVEGTMGQIPGQVLLVQTEEDVAALDLPADTPVAYVTQTTLSVDDTQRHHRGAAIAASTTSSGPAPRTSATRHKIAKPRCANSASWWT